MKRHGLSPMKRLRIFEAAAGLCHLCGLRIKTGEMWEVEHRIPLALGRADDETNMAPAHKACHAPKTADDVAAIARAKRRAAKHVGIKKTPSFYRPPDAKYDWKRRRYIRSVLQ